MLSLALVAALSLPLQSCRRRADLLAMREGVDMTVGCRLDAEGRLIVTIRNQGKKTSKATTTQIEFGDLPPVRLPTRPVPPGGAESVSYRVPEECYRPDCRFRVSVDALDEVAETDETNNDAQGFCPAAEPLNPRSGSSGRR